jgi:hypothetical protein
MLYVGTHKGTPDDGYVCSGKLMIEEYNKRPHDFKREVMAFGSYNDMINFETKILKAVNAARDKSFYNQHNGDGNFYCKGHSEETKNKIKTALTGKKRTAEHCARISNSKKNKVPPGVYTRKSYKGVSNPNYGKHASEATKAIWKQQRAKKYNINGVIYLGYREIMAKFNLNSESAVAYRVKSTSKKFKGWNFEH